MATSSALASPVRLRLDAPAWLRVWHLTSLDAPTVAVSWALALAWAARIRLPLAILAGLGLAAWALYIADRLMDARSGRGELRLRHYFHWRHRRWFVPVAMVAAVAAWALCTWTMPWWSRNGGAVMAVAAVAYFGSVHGRPRRSGCGQRTIAPFPKELSVALVFTAACSTPAWAFAGSFPLQLMPCATCLAALAWLNCWAIEVWESCADAGLARSGGSDKLISVLGALLCALALMAAATEAMQHHPRSAALLLMAASSAASLAALNRLREHLTPTALRVMADAVLLTPLIVLAAR